MKKIINDKKKKYERKINDEWIRNMKRERKPKERKIKKIEWITDKEK